MYGQAHVGLGWVIGTVAPRSDRRLRVWCASAAILPDIDALTFLLGKEVYDRWHHTFGHNVFLGMLATAVCVWHYRDRGWKERVYASTLVALCFASHILTDMKLSGWLVEIFWPLSRAGYEFNPNLQLGAPINTWLVYILMVLPFILAFWKRVTPLEIVSPRLDRIVLRFFHRRTGACRTCSAACNQVCDGCGQPTCMKHGRIGWTFRIACPACAPTGGTGGG